VRRQGTLRAKLTLVAVASLCAGTAWAEGNPGVMPGADTPVMVASALVRPPGARETSAPASQAAPASQPSFRLRLASSTTGGGSAPPPKLDLELRAAPRDTGPRLHRVKPFVEMLSYQAFVTAAGWVYGNSPLDWEKPSWSKWKYRVTHAPIWSDGDHWLLNVGGHAIFGSDHYLMARNCGWSWYSSAFFTTFGSFFWEYIREGIFERPSLIDLVTTPILGTMLGEARYRLFRLVRKHWDHRWYGKVLLAILDPTTMFFEMWGWR
jgi:hypothetical protein